MASGQYLVTSVHQVSIVLYCTVLPSISTVYQLEQLSTQTTPAIFFVQFCRTTLSRDKIAICNCALAHCITNMTSSDSWMTFLPVVFSISKLYCKLEAEA